MAVKELGAKWRKPWLTFWLKNELFKYINGKDATNSGWINALFFLIKFWLDHQI